jgi:hypothetical protein
MRISNKILIGLFILVLIALNLHIIPQQRKVQLELEKNAIWKIPTLVDISLGYVLFSPNSLIQSFSNEHKFKLQSFDLKTGELMHTKVFSKEIGAANKVVCIKEALYVVFATSGIYKLDATTLEVIWRTDWSLEVYNWEAIDIERSKDLILISSFNPYWSFYSFIKEETGEIDYYQRQPNESIIKDAIINIFSPYKGEHNWADYYNFKNHKFIFDDKSKEILFIEDDYLLDISDSLNLISFAYDYRSYKNIHTRSSSMEPFTTRKNALFLKNGITASYKKKITNVQTSNQSFIFCFEKVKTSTSNDIIVDYALIKKNTYRSDLYIHNVVATPQAYVSDDYFVTLIASNQSQNHKEILITDLNTLKVKQSFYLPFEQKLLKLFCDQNHLYTLIQKADGKTYWLAIPITS